MNKKCPDCQIEVCDPSCPEQVTARTAWAEQVYSG